MELNGDAVEKQLNSVRLTVVCEVCPRGDKKFFHDPTLVYDQIYSFDVIVRTHKHVAYGTIVLLLFDFCS